MPVFTTIIPIFIIVMLGWGVHRRGGLPSEFLAPVNVWFFKWRYPPSVIAFCFAAFQLLKPFFSGKSEILQPQLPGFGP